MNRKLFSIGLACLIALFLVPDFVQSQDSRPIVRLIYFLPKDRQPQPDIDAKFDKWIKDVQQLYANLMEAHGFGRKTFQFETDAGGNAVVHHFVGQFTDAHYSNLSDSGGIWGGIWGEIDKQFDTSKNIYVTAVDVSKGLGERIRGIGGARGSSGGKALTIIASNTDGIILHELAHAFGLMHDHYTNNAKRISVFSKFLSVPMLDSSCAAEWLNAHRAFNSERQIEQDEPSHFKMLPPSLISPPNVIRLRFEISDPNGIGQVQLLAPITLPDPDLSLFGCKDLNGNISGTVEFVTNDLTPKTRYVQLHAIDVLGNPTWSQEFPINVTSLIPPSETVSIPDPHLAAAVQQEIGDTMTTHAMLNLRILDIRNIGITDLTGIEYASNLMIFHLEAEDIEGNGHVNDNTVLDLQPLAGLENLYWLYLHRNNIPDISALSRLTNLSTLYLRRSNISNISALSGLTNLNTLELWANNITDISALSRLTNLNRLDLGANNISDVSVLSRLTNLNTLELGANNISDISALSALENLAWLALYNNNISDISALSRLTNLNRLYLWNNPLSYTSINTHIPAMQAKGVEIDYTQRTPRKLLKISGDAQQAVTNSELPLPFVVQVQDEYNRAYAEVPVTFSITEGSGKLSTRTTTTDAKGRAKTRFTLGQTVGETIIRATAAKISQPIQFTVTAILPTAFVQLPDKNLTAKIAETLGKPAGASITAADMLTLTSLTANNTGISVLTGLQHASNLTTLMLDGNNLSNIDSLTGLPHLTTLSLENNNVSNIAPLVELTQLETLSLENNKLSDVAPLAELTELKTLRLRGNLLSYPSLYTTIPSLRSRGVNVWVDTRTPTTLINIPGTPGVAGAARQVTVQVQDEKDIAFAGVPVNFTLTAAGGHRSTSKVISDLNGKATTTFTLGPEPGENVVSATVIEISQPLNFTITTIDANTLVHIPDVNLHAKIAETLNKPKNAKLSAGDLSELTSLEAPSANIEDLSGIEYAHNLSRLELWDNNITDISALSALTSLNTLNLLDLSNNNITDISALSALTNLTWLGLDSNDISDISVLSRLTNLNLLDLSNNNITDISALSALTNLTWLDLDRNDISNISVLSVLANLNTLNLSFNNITDISVLSRLTNLTWLGLKSNKISDMSPVLALNLTGTRWDSIGLYLQDNPLNNESIRTHIPAMQARGIVISFDNITHPEFLIISGDKQEELLGRTLPSPFVVEYRDANGKPKEGVKVTFSIADGDAELMDTTVTTDAGGRAQTFLISGWKLGTITVRATAEGVITPLTFTASIVLPENHVAEDVNADGVVDVEDLVLVAATIGTIPPEDTYPNPDVNGDGVVNRDDLAVVMAALETTPAAPAAVITAKNLQRWIDAAKRLTNRDETFQRGIAVLEQLLSTLLPEKTALLANYPNPFNPETWIPYHLSKPAKVKLTIYGIDGNVVRHLDLGHQVAGFYQRKSRAAYWDGRNNIGEPVASGVYFYTLSTESTRDSVTAGEFTATRKMLIRK